VKNRNYFQPHYVYRIYDERRRCLYVGCSINPMVRIRFHRSKSWGGEIHHYDITEHVWRPAALAVERRETKRLNPIHNLVDTPRDPNLRANRERPAS